MQKPRTPRRLSLVWLASTATKRRYPFLKEGALVFLGEIPNMKGQCIVIGVKTGQLYVPYDTRLFTELKVKKVKS